MTDVLKNSFRKQTRNCSILIVSTILGDNMVADEVDFSPASTASTSTEPKSRRLPVARKRDREDESEAPITLLERVDEAALEFMRQNVELLVKEERTKFLRYAETMLAESCALRIGYRLKEHGYGRYYPDVVSMQGLSRRLRSTLATPLYEDIDASNAHPVVLAAISNERNWYTPCLDYYIAHREDVLASTGLPRSMAKQLMLQQTYGGSVRNFLIDKIENDKYLAGSVAKWMGRIPRFVYEYGQEIRQIANQVRLVDPAIYQVALSRKKDNVAASALSLLVQTRETAAIMCAMETMRGRGWEIGVLVHDGFMVYKREAEGLTITPGLLNLLRQRVKEKCGLTIHFETKEFEPTFKEKVVPVELPN